MPLFERLRAPKIALIRAIYDVLYRFTIPKTAMVVVQQEWVRRALVQRYGLVWTVVAHPVDGDAERSRPEIFADKLGMREILYPLSPHPYKNAELACRAVAMLEESTPGRYHLLLTIRGDENGYARWLFAQFAACRAIEFGGPLPHAALQRRYQQSHLLLFPSRTETWGLPITEAKVAGLGIIAADLPYAHETVGAYDAAGFVDPDDPQELAAMIQGCWEGNSLLKSVPTSHPSEPYVATWNDLIDHIVKI
jgi:glycosyltransferase involved in cell wall biosynthesis